MNNLYTLISLFALVFFSGLNCHNRTANVGESRAMGSVNALNWHDLQMQSNRIDSNLSALTELCKKFDTTPKKIVPQRVELVNPGSGPNTFILNDSTTKK